MKWISILRQGYIDVARVRYDLSHLFAGAFALDVPASAKFPAATARVHVEYTSHCVSFGPRAGAALDFDVLGRERRILDHRNVARAFCADRHRWSCRLPGIVAQLGERRCYFTGHSNWLVIEDITEHGDPVEYEVFFRLRRAGASVLRLVIESAYVRDISNGKPGVPRNRRSIVRFRVMAAKILRGEPIRDPSLNSH
ncbi:hypothetical protein NDK50_23995 [Paraburkholderia bryophila]|uniref:hypothetical protein n=1 Tax=Paraburkholderia bryophila TaxID=420952 RepID=UPI00234A60DE|nr:hypothetical protein [Paraburkholderia bryophila]WCM23909.1 hypothetical protein NDK50_23995 [Paraburkholderia bryophila]